MPLPQSKKKVGLGNMLMKDRFGGIRGSDRKKASSIARVNHVTGEQYVVNEHEDASWVKMRSITEQGALDEFLSTAELAGTDFTAEKMSNVKIIHTDQRNPYLPTFAEEQNILGKHKAHRSRLTVPRRPQWDETTTPQQLDRMERESFLAWRRGLAELQENNDLLMTPFERNLEVWRQLWRVIERSDIVVQIVDARNPLLFRSEDLEQYVRDVDPKKQNLLLINKADMMTEKQRRIWADHLKSAGISYKFFSAHLAKEMNEVPQEGVSRGNAFAVLASEDSSGDEKDQGEEKQEKKEADQAGQIKEESPQQKQFLEEAPAESPEVPRTNNEDQDIRILTVKELESIFFQYAPKDLGPSRKLQVGLVGYPNVGKSSTINALLGATKVSVSATPGKTKHFQTIHLSDRVVLCDCPGLVFPNFATTKADLVCNGVLPIDQLREHQGPVGLVAQRIPRPFLEAVYGIQIPVRPLEEGGTGIPTASELLSAYAKVRGFQTQGLGQPDESRAARYILKDYVSGKLLFCHPPTPDTDAAEFNKELYDIAHLPAKRRQALAQSLDSLSLADSDSVNLLSPNHIGGTGNSSKSENLDRGFFASQARNNGHMTMPFSYRYSEQGREAMAQHNLTGRKARSLFALEHGLDAKDVALIEGNGKKHYKLNTKGNKGKRRAAARATHEA